MTYYELNRYPPLDQDTDIEQSTLTFYKDGDDFEVSLTLTYKDGYKETFGPRTGEVTGWDEDDKMRLLEQAMILLESSIGKKNLAGKYSWMKNFTGTDLRDRYFFPAESWRYG